MVRVVFPSPEFIRQVVGEASYYVLDTNMFFFPSAVRALRPIDKFFVGNVPQTLSVIDKHLLPGRDDLLTSYAGFIDGYADTVDEIIANGVVIVPGSVVVEVSRGREYLSRLAHHSRRLPVHGYDTYYAARPVLEEASLRVASFVDVLSGKDGFVDDGLGVFQSAFVPRFARYWSGPQRSSVEDARILTHALYASAVLEDRVLLLSFDHGFTKALQKETDAVSRAQEWLVQEVGSAGNIVALRCSTDRGVGQYRIQQAVLVDRNHKV